MASRLAILLLAATLAGCASTAPTANVVRFHGSQPVQRGTVAVQPANPQMAGTLEFAAQSEAVATELRRQGFTVVSPPAPAQFIATVDVETGVRTGQQRNSGVSIGIGGGFSSGNVGIGSSVQVPVGGSNQPNSITTTTLSVRIADAGTRAAVWEGRATMDSTGSMPAGTPATSMLAGALFREFPGQSGQSVRVAL